MVLADPLDLGHGKKDFSHSKFKNNYFTNILAMTHKYQLTLL